MKKQAENKSTVKLKMKDQPKGWYTDTSGGVFSCGPASTTDKKKRDIKEDVPAIIVDNEED